MWRVAELPDDTIHVWPISETFRHTLHGRECPCTPQVYGVCEECDAPAVCWKCGGSGRVEAGFDGVVIVVHEAGRV